MNVERRPYVRKEIDTLKQHIEGVNQAAFLYCEPPRRTFWGRLRWLFFGR